VKTGSIHEGAQLGAGLSHFLEHMLFKGTTRRAGREISATVQAHGGYINAYTTFDRTVYYIDLPAEHTAVAIDVLADAVLHSTLPADETRGSARSSCARSTWGRTIPDHRLGETLFATAFREHPYRHPIIGYREVFSALTRDDLLAYYRARYVPNNLVVVVVGAFDPAATRGRRSPSISAPRRARGWPRPDLPGEPLQLAAASRTCLRTCSSRAPALAGRFPGSHPDAPALDVLATILGGGDSSVCGRPFARRRISCMASMPKPGIPARPGCSDFVDL
jgi:zinc protease